ncbi:MAG TPA: SAV_6107 family HEPN domain-containing protein [Lapillicoccus sp.]|nr:SAV_6107 family HEPN domain-containing protein [Lapillicoccus sp.]
MPTGTTRGTTPARAGSVAASPVGSAQVLSPGKSGGSSGRSSGESPDPSPPSRGSATGSSRGSRASSSGSKASSSGSTESSSGSKAASGGSSRRSAKKSSAGSAKGSSRGAARTSSPETTPDVRTSRPPVASTSLDLLDRSRASLLEACRTSDAGERYVEAHLGALRAAAALLAARSLPSGAGSSSSGRAIRTSTTRSRPRSVWELLPRVAPELTEWAAFFATSARRRAAIERGGRIGARESDDLLRQAENFLEIVQDLLGLPRDDTLAPISRYVAPVSWSGPAPPEEPERGT